jgi:hypothetical protein
LASNLKGITLLRDTVVTIGSDYSVDATYGSEKLVAISAGIDGALWALQYEPLVDNETLATKDYSVLKW